MCKFTLSITRDIQNVEHYNTLLLLILLTCTVYILQKQTTKLWLN